MNVLALALTALVAALHVVFMLLEMVFWTKPLGRKIFKRTVEEANSSASLAMNQGLYNGFLAAGLAWSLVSGDPAQAFALKVFFLGCVIVAGLFGAATASRTILFVQALPAAIALGLVWASRGG